MILTVSRKEKFQLQYLLPIQGNLNTLLMTQRILNKIQIEPGDAESDEVIDIDFDDEEIKFISEMIAVLDQSQKLNLSCLPLIQKILNNRS